MYTLSQVAIVLELSAKMKSDNFTQVSPDLKASTYTAKVISATVIARLKTNFGCLLVFLFVFFLNSVFGFLAYSLDKDEQTYGNSR